MVSGGKYLFNFFLKEQNRPVLSYSCSSQTNRGRMVCITTSTNANKIVGFLQNQPQSDH